MICTDGFIAGLPSFIDNLPDLLDPAWSWEVVTSPDAFMLRVKGSCPSRARCCCWLAAAWEEFNCRRVRFIDQTKARAPKLDTPYRLAEKACPLLRPVGGDLLAVLALVLLGDLGLGLPVLGGPPKESPKSVLGVQGSRVDNRPGSQCTGRKCKNHDPADPQFSLHRHQGPP